LQCFFKEGEAVHFRHLEIREYDAAAADADFLESFLRTRGARGWETIPFEAVCGEFHLVDFIIQDANGKILSRDFGERPFSKH
jgi:hypothetical protein